MEATLGICSYLAKRMDVAKRLIGFGRLVMCDMPRGRSNVLDAP